MYGSHTDRVVMWDEASARTHSFVSSPSTSRALLDWRFSITNLALLTAYFFGEAVECADVNCDGIADAGDLAVEIEELG